MEFLFFHEGKSGAAALCREKLQNAAFVLLKRRAQTERDRKLWEDRVKVSQARLRGWETVHTEQMRSKHAATGSH